MRQDLGRSPVALLDLRHHVVVRRGPDIGGAGRRRRPAAARPPWREPSTRPRVRAPGIPARWRPQKVVRGRTGASVDPVQPGCLLRRLLRRRQRARPGRRRPGRSVRKGPGHLASSARRRPRTWPRRRPGGPGRPECSSAGLALQLRGLRLDLGRLGRPGPGCRRRTPRRASRARPGPGPGAGCPARGSTPPASGRLARTRRRPERPGARTRPRRPGQRRWPPRRAALRMPPRPLGELLGVQAAALDGGHGDLVALRAPSRAASTVSRSSVKLPISGPSCCGVMGAGCERPALCWSVMGCGSRSASVQPSRSAIARASASRSTAEASAAAQPGQVAGHLQGRAAVLAGLPGGLLPRVALGGIQLAQERGGLGPGQVCRDGLPERFVRPFRGRLARASPAPRRRLWCRGVGGGEVGRLALAHRAVPRGAALAL